MSRKLSSGRALVLAAVLICVLAGLFLLVAAISLPDTRVLTLRSCILLLAGGALLFLSLVDSGRPYRFFLGQNLCFAGVLLLFGDSGILPLTSRNIWPLIVIMAGASLFPMSIYNQRKLLAKYLVPALGLIAIGLLYLVFALRLTGMSISQFFARWWLLFVLLVGALFVAVFFFQKQGGKLPQNIVEIVEEPENFFDVDADDEDVNDLD